MTFVFSQHAKDVIEHRSIKKEWVSEVIQNLLIVNEINTKEKHLFGKVKENGNRCLKVVVNSETNIIVTAYFDRKMTKGVCK